MSFCVTMIQCQEIAATLHQTPVAEPHYPKLAKLHRLSAALAATLATRLRLTPHSRLTRTGRKTAICRWPDEATIARRSI
jgi:hypothetical protein